MTGGPDPTPDGSPDGRGRPSGLRRIVIVGGGMAAHAAAERLRVQGFTGQLDVLSAENRPPYNRTPLSKQLLTGDYVPSQLGLPAFTDLDATWHLGVTATGLDTAARTVTTSTGPTVPYDGLVLATGVRARLLPGAPLHTEHVHMLRTLGDAHEVDRSLTGTTDRVAVVGGGFIGCEVASTARTRGLDVTIVDLSPHLLQHGLGKHLGATVDRLHQDNGVRLHLGVAVKTWDVHDRGVRLTLTSGELIDADMAVVGIGTDPHLQWLEGSGLDAADGIAATATCHALGPDGQPLPTVVVAGDAARWPNHRFDGVPRRVEHWINAIEMGQAAATNLLAGPAAAQPFTPVPRFWSEQHGVKIQSAGMPALGDTMTVIAGTLDSQRFLAAYTRGDTLMGLIAFDHTQQLIDHAPLVGRPVTLPATRRR